MSRFATNAFSFELPDDGWVEKTLHMFRPPDDPQSAFAISRTTPVVGGKNSILDVIEALPKGGPYDEREVLRSERRGLGAVDIEDVSVLARRGTMGEYYRIVSIPYYGKELNLQWAGPIAQRDTVDARAERALQTLRFRQPW
jgi:hypothetical protein